MTKSLQKRSKNHYYHTLIKFFTNAVSNSIMEKHISATPKLFSKLTSILDKAVKKGVIHKNRAARKKTKMVKFLTQKFPGF